MVGKFHFFICVFLYVFSAGEDTFPIFLLYILIIIKLLILFIYLFKSKMDPIKGQCCG